MKWLKLPNKIRGRLINFYAPYIGAGIRVTSCNEQMDRFEVSMNLNRFNKNIMGTHFGGSLYSRCDPFFMWILMENLGKDFIVWDKAATIHFRKPGKGKVSACFKIETDEIEAIRAEVMELGKKDYTFHAEVLGEQGELVASVEKLVYVRYKHAKRQAQT